MTVGDYFQGLVYFVFMGVYLLMIFQVIADLFGRDDIGGWGKAGWLLVLLAIPLLTMLVYVITQGTRSRRSAQARQAALQAIPPTRGSDYTQQIGQAHELLLAGAITEAEYDAIKTKALA